jgi:hypothetical protein
MLYQIYFIKFDDFTYAENSMIENCIEIFWCSHFYSLFHVKKKLCSEKSIFCRAKALSPIWISWDYACYGRYWKYIAQDDSKIGRINVRYILSKYSRSSLIWSFLRTFNYFYAFSIMLLMWIVDFLWLC